MSHDPLCPWDAEGDPDECYQIEGLERPMTICQLIARVREDKQDKNIGTVSLGELAKAQEHTYNAGYAAALRDAVEAVKALPWSHNNWMSVGERAQAIAAIEGLEISNDTL